MLPNNISPIWSLILKSINYKRCLLFKICFMFHLYFFFNTVINNKLLVKLIKLILVFFQINKQRYPAKQYEIKVAHAAPSIPNLGINI